MSRPGRGGIDRALGIETTRKERLGVRPGDPPVFREARDYQPTPPEVFEAMMTACPFPPEATTFIDLGAGKGRVLCLAAGLPFREVLGVELVDAWAKVARRNLSCLDPSYVRAGRMRCITGDAAGYSYPPGPKVAFLFNPFGPRVLARVLERLDTGAAPLSVLYYEPVHAARVDARPGLTRVAETKLWTAWATVG